MACCLPVLTLEGPRGGGPFLCPPAQPACRPCPALPYPTRASHCRTDSREQDECTSWIVQTLLYFLRLAKRSLLPESSTGHYILWSSPRFLVFGLRPRGLHCFFFGTARRSRSKHFEKSLLEVLLSCKQAPPPTHSLFYSSSESFLDCLFSYPACQDTLTSSGSL